MNVLMIPGRRRLWEAATGAALAVYSTEHAWTNLTNAQEYPSVYSDEKRTIAASEFLRAVDPAIENCSALIKALDDSET